MRNSSNRSHHVFLLCLCATGLCWVGLARAQDKPEQVTVNNVNRAFVVHLPKGYNAQEHYPVVLLLHSRQQDADDMAHLSRFNEVADRYGIIAVYPNATQGHWNIGISAQQPSSRQRGDYSRHGGGGLIGMAIPGMGGGMGRRGGASGSQDSQRDQRRQPSNPQTDDVAFISTMLDKLSSSYAVDVSRIYATGLSDGGLMDFHLGCRLSNRLAAIAPVGAEMPTTMVCTPARVLSVLMINGTSDPVMPYEGSSGKAGSYATVSAQDSAKTWATLDNCGTKPERSTLPPRTKGGTKIQVDTYGCNPGVQVVLYSIKGAGNTWPGGEQYLPEKQIGKTSTDLDTNEVIWKFFAAHRLPVPVPIPRL
jgi:polyhydroxybutyrate depolymerase